MRERGKGEERDIWMSVRNPSAWPHDVCLGNQLSSRCPFGVPQPRTTFLLSFSVNVAGVAHVNGNATCSTLLSCWKSRRCKWRFE